MAATILVLLTCVIPTVTVALLVLAFDTDL